MKHFVTLFCVALPVLAGCGPSPAQPAPAPAPASMLSVSAVTVQLSRVGSPFFQYAPASLELIETSGTHAATLIELDVTAEGGRADRGCPMEPLRIGPGERLDLVKAMGYCIPYVVTTSEVSAMTVSATFRDDLKGVGHLRKTVSVQGCTLGGATGRITCQ